MGYQDNFSVEEWRNLQFSVLWVFHAIAEVDGVIDDEENAALFSAFEGEYGLTNELLSEVLDSISKDPDAILKAFREDTLGLPMGIKAVAELVEAKLPEGEALAFKRSLLILGVIFAKAANEIPGDTSGTRVDETERAAILTVAAILRLSLEDLML